MSDPNFPTLLYPNGGETILVNEIVVSWSVPSPASPDNRAVAYELYYTDTFDPLKEPDWKQIADLPSTSTQHVWRFGNSIRSTRCRVAIRSRNGRGERSRFTVSAADFSIHRRKLESPTLISPIGSDRFDKSIEIIPDDSGIVGSHSERSFYQFYYSSAEANIPLTAIAQNVPIGVGSITWKTINLPPAKDYVLQAYLADDDGNVSDSIFVRHIEIAHEGFFVIDTLPPQSSVVINDNDTFTKDRTVSVTVVSYDEATAVHSMQLKDDDSESSPEPSSDATVYELSAGDAVKTVELLLQDYGANRNDDQTQRLFDVLVETDSGVKVADIATDRLTSTTWVITSTPHNSLYKIKSFPSLVTAFEDEPTAVAVFGSFTYVGVKTTDSLGILMQFNGYEAVVSKEFTESDSVINAMTVHGKLLFIGFENGVVYKFDGLNFTKINGTGNPVRSLVSDGSLLYLTERNGTDVFVYNGTEFVSTGAE